MKKANLFGTTLLAAVLAFPVAVFAEPEEQGVNGSQEQVSLEAAQPAPVLLAAAVDGGPWPGPAGGAEGAERPAPSAAPGPDGPVSDRAVEEESIADPIEPWNRAMYHFNDKLYFWVLKPTAQGYSYVAPEPVRLSVRNFFANVLMPMRFVNCLLQGKIGGAGVELGRFGINTTLGVGGLFDVAQAKFDLSAQKEDLGQTLGHYGMPGMFYIVWPVFGPMTFRDTIGFAGDWFLDPVNYFDSMFLSVGIHAYDKVNDTSLRIGQYEDLKKDSFEPYTAIKDAYIQYRKGLIEK